MTNSFAPYFEGFGNPKTFSLEDENTMLPGIWRTQYQMGMLLNQDELIFQDDGSYSVTSVANGIYSMWLAGNWEFVGSGTVRITYTDYSPKNYGGNPIHIPATDTFYIRFLEPTRLVLLNLNAIANKVG